MLGAFAEYEREMVKERKHPAEAAWTGVVAGADIGAGCWHDDRVHQSVDGHYR
ncbi:MAG: hypothetical protein ACREFN_06200 [Acetobacteraceae bacterium]